MGSTEEGSLHSRSLVVFPVKPILRSTASNWTGAVEERSIESPYWAFVKGIPGASTGELMHLFRRPWPESLHLNSNGVGNGGRPWRSTTPVADNSPQFRHVSSHLFEHPQVRDYGHHRLLTWSLAAVVVVFLCGHYTARQEDHTFTS